MVAHTYAMFLLVLHCLSVEKSQLGVGHRGDGGAMLVWMVRIKLICVAGLDLGLVVEEPGQAHPLLLPTREDVLGVLCHGVTPN